MIAAMLTMVIAATTVITEAQQLLQQTTVEVTQEVKHHQHPCYTIDAVNTCYTAARANN